MNEIERRWFIGSEIFNIEVKENETIMYVRKQFLEHSIIIDGPVKNIFDLTENEKDYALED